MLSLCAYARGTHYLGALGTSVGWGIHMALIVVFASLLGFVKGEWKGAPRPSLVSLFLGLAILAGATVLTAWGNTLVPA